MCEIMNGKIKGLRKLMLSSRNFLPGENFRTQPSWENFHLENSLSCVHRAYGNHYCMGDNFISLKLFL